MREVHDLELAYQIVKDAERFHRSPVYRRPDTPRISVPNQQIGPSQSRFNRPNPNAPVTRRDDKGKSPEVQRNPNACFKCQKVGHYASNCPNRSLHIGKVEEEAIEPQDECEEEIYQVDENLAEEYEGDEALVDHDLLGVVRCERKMVQVV